MVSAYMTAIVPQKLVFMALPRAVYIAYLWDLLEGLRSDSTTPRTSDSQVLSALEETRFPIKVCLRRETAFGMAILDRGKFVMVLDENQL